MRAHVKILQGNITMKAEREAFEEHVARTVDHIKDKGVVHGSLKATWLPVTDKMWLICIIEWCTD